MKDFIHALDPVTWVYDTHQRTLDPWHEKVARSSAKRVLLCCSRQAGKSTCVSVLAAHRALFRPGSLVLCLAPTQRQSGELFRKINALLPHGERSLDSQSTLELGNGSRILSLPGRHDSIRSFSAVNLLCIDEAAFADDDLFAAVSPMLAVSNGTLIALSSPNGKRGWFYEQFINESPLYEHVKVTAEQCPRISAAFLESERASMTPAKFASEYQCVFGDAEHAAFTGVDDIFSDEVEML
jgi:Terminase large subunit, T4likevirus-type, N-terminal